MYTAEKNACVPVEMPRETLTEKLSRERDRLMTRVEEIDAVLAMLKSNPPNILRGVSVTALQAAQTHCKRGHELSGSNLYVNNGCRVCKACRASFTKAYRERNVEKVANARKDRYDRTGT